MFNEATPITNTITNPITPRIRLAKLFPGGIRRDLDSDEESEQNATGAAATSKPSKTPKTKTIVDKLKMGFRSKPASDQILALDFDQSDESKSEIHEMEKSDQYAINEDSPHNSTPRKLKAPETPETELRQSKESNNSIVHIHIRDFESHNGISNTYQQTGAALRRCKVLVLDPYWRLLKLIAWRPIGIGSFGTCHNYFFGTFNFVYPLTVALLLLFTYILEILACIGDYDVGKLNDTESHQREIAKHHPTNNHSWGNMSDIVPMRHRCNHIVTTYCVADILHFSAFCMGLYGERVVGSEQLYSLMEKAFLAVSPIAGAPALKNAQKFLMRRLRIFIYCGLLWMMLAAGLRILFSLAYRGGIITFTIDIWIYSKKNMQVSHIVPGDFASWTLAILQYIGVFFYHSVNLAIIANYAAECELLRSLIHSLASQLQGKSISLKEAMKEIIYVQNCIRQLNGQLSRMASLVLVGSLEIWVLGIVYLFCLGENASVAIWVYRLLHVIIYTMLVFLPFYEAARLNATCLKFRSIALDARVFGYQSASQIDLDSFLNFVTTIAVKAKLLMMPIKHTVFAAVVVVASIALLLLIQLSVITPNQSWF